MKYDFLVIGGGLSGMSSALLLARHGYSVALAEQAPALGPTLRGFSRQGIHFSTGLHYTGCFAPGGILERYFKMLGLEGLQREAYDEHGFDCLRFSREKKEFFFPTGYERIEYWLCELFPREKQGIRRYLNDVRAGFESSPFLNIERPFSRNKRTEIPQETALSDYFINQGISPLLQSILSAHALLYGVSPEKCPFSNHARIVGSYYLSVHGIKGGGLALARACEQALKKAGIAVFCGHKVKRIHIDTSLAITGAELATGQNIEAKKIICTIHPKAFLKITPKNAFRPAYLHRLASLQETPSAYMLFGIADEPIPSLEGRNIFACGESRIEKYFIQERWPDQGPFYITSTRTREKTARRSITVLVPGHITDCALWADSGPDNRPSAYKEFKHRQLDRFRNALIRVCPELAGVHFIDGATPLTLRDYMGNPAGSLYGPQHSMDQFSPDPATRLKGLLLAGQAIVAPGILGAVISAFLACGFVIGHDTLRKELIACS